MSKIFYRYNPDTGLLVTTYSIVDTYASTADKVVYTILPNSTDIAPGADIPGKVQFFDKKTNSWRYTEDNRGVKVINKTTKQIVEWDKIGLIPNDYTKLIPEEDTLPYVTWQGTYWDVVGEDRDKLLNDIWEKRKSNRDRQCAADLIYNGHPIHVDAVSFNDITMAAQEALLTQDMSTTKRWVTADDVNVQLCGNDFVAIMRMYGERRQRLVYESNEAWQQDTTKSTEELFTLLRTL